ncbi:MAG: winged helix-turn-helix domain-containing protein [Candidatus Bathyarchaeia archaeon]
MVGESEAKGPGRSRIEIMVCILGNSDPNSGKARLLQVCNLTSPQFNLYKNFLVESALLEVSTTEDVVDLLETTVKGKEFLKQYREIEGLNRL